METLISIKQAAEMLGVSQETLRNWDKSKQLNPLRTKGKHRRYRLSDIEKLQNEDVNEKTNS